MGLGKAGTRRLRRALLPALLGAAAGAGAQGFATRDLSALGPAAAAALGPGFDARAEPRRLTIACARCADEPVVDVLLGRQEDGTEQRVRSGATRIADLERICRARSPACRLSALDVPPAVGWVSSYPLGDRAGATAILLEDGDLLTIRSLGADPASARRAVDRLLPLVHSRLLGGRKRAG